MSAVSYDRLLTAHSTCDTGVPTWRGGWSFSWKNAQLYKAVSKSLGKFFKCISYSVHKTSSRWAFKLSREHLKSLQGAELKCLAETAPKDLSNKQNK